MTPARPSTSSGRARNLGIKSFLDEVRRVKEATPERIVKKGQVVKAVIVQTVKDALVVSLSNHEQRAPGRPPRWQTTIE
jgi:ribosomal protein L14